LPWSGKRAFNHVRQLAEDQQPAVKSSPAVSEAGSPAPLPSSLKPLENDGFALTVADSDKVQQLCRDCCFLFPGAASQLLTSAQITHITSDIHTLYDCPTSWCGLTFATGSTLQHHLQHDKCQPTVCTRHFYNPLLIPVIACRSTFRP
jgi:hypothetical protein